MNARTVCACLAVAAAMVGCGSDDDSVKAAGGAAGASGASSHGGADAGASGDAGAGAVSRADVVKTYAANLARGYNDAVQDEKDFKVVVAAFLADPTEPNLDKARTSWLDSRAHYMLTEGARFYGGPIDRDPPNDEGLVNSWPLDEAYIDYTTTNNASGDQVVNENVGIINLPSVLATITAEGLDDLNAKNGDENISAGYHAVEFLLWGQALTETGPGRRPASDYDLKGPRKNPDRRAKYLTVAIDGIISHLQDVAAGWTPTADYRVGFEAHENESDSLTKIFTGLAKFSKGELAGQRIRAAYASKDRRDQHDCFSSKSLTDYTRDAIGIQNMYLGVYGDNDGPGLDDLIRAVDPAEDTKLQGLLQASIRAINAIPEPFEASIAGADSSPGRKAISAAINALSAQGDELGVAAGKLGLSITVDDPEE